MVFNRQDIRKLLDGEMLSRPPVWPLLYLESCARRFGIPWISEVREDSLVRIDREAGFDRIHYLSLDMSCALLPLGPSLDRDVVEWDVDLEETHDRRKATSRLDTPHGQMVRVSSEAKGCAPQVHKHPVETAADLPKYEWYLDQWLANGERIVADHTHRLREYAGEADFLIVEGIGPLEMCCMTELVPRIYMMHDAPDEFFHAEEKTLDVSILQATTALKNGADAIIFGVRAAEIYSPQIFEEHLIRLLPKLADAIHDAGGYFFVHSCGLNTDFVQRGYYNRLGCDLFDGLGTPPEGDVVDLPHIRECLGKDMCTRGNVSVNKLATSTPEEVREITAKLLREIEGYRHIVAASCCINPATPWENITALVETVRGE